jgi:hypothetical protein
VEAEELMVEAEAPAVEAEAPAGSCWMGLAVREVEGGAVLDWGWWRTGRCWTGRRPRRRSGGRRTSVDRSVEVQGEAEVGGGGGSRCTRAEAEASESRCGGRAVSGGRTGRERWWRARGSWQCGSKSSERERQGARHFFCIR